MATFRFSPAHDGTNPPVGSIHGTLSGAEGSYEVQLVVSGTGALFAGPVPATLGPSGKAPVTVPINDCGGGGVLMNATLRSQIKEDGSWKNSLARNVNYRCP